MIATLKKHAADLGFIRSRIATDQMMSYLMLAMPYQWSSKQSRRYFGLFTCHDNYQIAVIKLKILRKTIAPLFNVEAKKMKIFCNSSLNEKYLAHQSGLGIYGKNSLIIVPEWGSFVVIAALELPYLFTPDLPITGLDLCNECTICQKSCPTRALENAYQLDRYRCAQHWASSGMQPPPFFEKKSSKIIYGCDLCQLGCPYNQKAREYYDKNRLKEEDTPWTSINQWLSGDKNSLELLVKKSPMKFSWLNKENLQKNAKRIVKIE